VLPPRIVTDQAEPVCLSDFERYAKARLTPGAFAYYSGGAGREVSLGDNEAAFTRRRLRPRMLVDVSQLNTELNLFGSTFAVPFGIAPTAQHGLAHPQAEAATARAAASENTLYCASTSSTLSCEAIADASRSGDSVGPRWFQLYVQDGDGEKTEALLNRALRAGYQAIVLTVDLPVSGLRLRERRERFELDAQSFGNFPGEQRAFHPTSAAGYGQPRSRASFTWRELAWLRARTPVPLVVKGVLTGEDAALALDHGVDAVWVSNHGGRQLDGASAPLEALEEVSSVVAGRVPVFVDGGVRRGTDVAMALGLGAQLVFVGRPILYALAYAGEAGVRLALRLLREELHNAMALLGTPSLSDITRDCVR
jgi:4-hydroxymandelate oxidase